MTESTNTTMTDDKVYIHPDINEFMLIQGIKLSLFKNPDGRLSVTMNDELPAALGESTRLDDKFLLREALRLRDSLNKMYPLSEY